MFKEKYDNMFYKIGMIYLKGYINELEQRKGKHWFNPDHLSRYNVPKEILSTLYAIMLKHKKIFPIEQMDEADRRTLWAEAKPFTIGMNDKDKMKVVRAVAVLNKLGELELKK